MSLHLYLCPRLYNNRALAIPSQVSTPGFQDHLLLTLTLQSKQLEISKPRAGLTPACSTMLGQTNLLIKVHRLFCLSNHIRHHSLPEPPCSSFGSGPVNLLSCLFLWRNLTLYFLRPQALCTHYSLCFLQPFLWLASPRFAEQPGNSSLPPQKLNLNSFIYLIPCKAHTLGGSKSFCKGPDGPGCSSVLSANKPQKRVDEELWLGSNKTVLTKLGGGLALDSRPLFANPWSIWYCLLFSYLFAD